MNNNFSNSILIIFERQLEERFSVFEELTGIDSYCCSLENIYGQNIVHSIYLRIKKRKEILKKQSEILKKIENKDKVFVSNGEGFIAVNLIEFIKKNSTAKVICLQHGIFELLYWSKFKLLIKRLINNITNTIFGIKVIGLGFGHIIADKYIVYCHPYKSFLIDRGWKNSDVIVSSFFLKGFNHNPNKVVDCLKKEKIALLAMQPMSAMNLMSKKDETILYKKLLKILVTNFDEVYIRQHPYCDVAIPIENPRIIKSNDLSLEDDIERVDIVVSFMSSVLVDFETTGKRFISVYTDKLKTYKSSYIAFKYIFLIDREENNNFNYVKNLNRESKFFYETGINSQEQLIKAI